MDRIWIVGCIVSIGWYEFIPWLSILLSSKHRIITVKRVALRVGRGGSICRYEVVPLACKVGRNNSLIGFFPMNIPIC